MAMSNEGKVLNTGAKKLKRSLYTGCASLGTMRVANSSG
jgi:hypothetical protein